MYLLSLLKIEMVEFLQLFDFKISTMIKEDGYCNYNFKDFILKRITTNLDISGSTSKIYYMSDIDEDITEIVF